MRKVLVSLIGFVLMSAMFIFNAQAEGNKVENVACSIIGEDCLSVTSFTSPEGKVDYELRYYTDSEILSIGPTESLKDVMVMFHYMEVLVSGQAKEDTLIKLRKRSDFVYIENHKIVYLIPTIEID